MQSTPNRKRSKWAWMRLLWRNSIPKRNDWKTKRNFSHQISCTPYGITLHGGIYMLLSERIKNLQKSQQILLPIKTRPYCHQNDSKHSSSSCCEHTNTFCECYCKSRKDCMHQICPDTSSLLRKGITAEPNQK